MSVGVLLFECVHNSILAKIEVLMIWAVSDAVLSIHNIVVATGAVYSQVSPDTIVLGSRGHRDLFEAEMRWQETWRTYSYSQSSDCCYKNCFIRLPSRGPSSYVRDWQ